MHKLLFIFLGILLSGCHAAQPPDGIIALTPSLAEAVLTFENAKLIAVSPFDENPQVSSLPRIDSAGGIERITAMRPRLVLLHSSDAQYAAKLNDMGIETRMYAMDTIQEVEQTVLDLGIFLHQEQTAQAAIAHMQQTLKANASTYKSSNPEQILVIVDRLDARMQQFYLAQSDAYLVDLVEGCGFKVISQSSRRWERIESEKLIHINPDSILFLAHDPKDAIEVQKQFELLYSNLKAVQNRRLFVYGNAGISIPGPQMGERQTTLCEFLNR